ncbi:MAG TPA: ATP-binding protein [Chthoniobacteraceae bacterium]|jgi:signal transduction histidine kinase/CheY-like chemotaxis protein|nr:ATP-binding protein [Chthoniobacteraceae bacterium]
MSSAASSSKADAARSLPAALQRRADALHLEQRGLLTKRIDHSFALLMVVQYGAGILAALVFAAHGPGLASSAGRAHVLMAVLLGALFTAPPVALAFLQPGAVWTRHTVAVGQMLMSGLLIHISGGRIETHFHIFGSLAFLAFYRDWRVLITASAIVAADHFVRGVFWPASIYGTAAADAWRWLEDTGWVIFEDAFLILSIRHSQVLLGDVALRRAELEQARDSAEQASRAKDEFLAVLSHELRTPLTPSLMTLAALCDSSRIDEETRDELCMVRRNVELEARLIDDLLDLTRITAGKLQLTSGNVDLHALLRHILETCRPEFRQKQIAVTKRMEAANFWCYGDSARLQQVFWNLVRNAIKFTPAGGRLEVRTQDAGDRIRIDFVDSGIGIAPDVLPKIFQRFEQGGTAVTKQFGGLGLGLSICRAIVELHRGVIRAESRGRGWGSTFTIVLPAKRDAPATVPPSQTQVLRVSGKLPRRVLLVDDHDDTRETLAKLLTRSGYDVTGAGTVQGALDKASTGTFDILVSDLGLPDGHGTDLMRALKEQYHLPGIAFSGYGMQDDVEKSLASGFSAHLTKPVDFKKLKEAMGEALHNAPRVAAVER